MSRRGQGDLFDEEAALERHVAEEHGGKTLRECPRCHELAHAIVASGQTYRYSGEGLCRLCGAELLWFSTPDGTQLPVDRGRFLEAWPGLAKPGGLRGFWTARRRGADVVLAYSHWPTCPRADEARRGAAWYEDDPTRRT